MVRAARLWCRKSLECREFEAGLGCPTTGKLCQPSSNGYLCRNVGRIRQQLQDYVKISVKICVVTLNKMTCQGISNEDHHMFFCRNMLSQLQYIYKKVVIFFAELNLVIALCTILHIMY